ncbi:LysR family transcriptional regulator [Propionivibrio dicarboxylicus]|uniref:Transcriptional regulator, LysR family n=1 Tax=Propionivibrio dicarboxylicus TaxID=83767 RepID=A0A1G8IZP2_9RHOO|nr:LysR family transcriptional regulator [Propionivibrio dicarboxylicus]SDI24273.1 transcriptional regulator, LysR family [Propionivibrio dicarboxylicus]
MNLKQLEYFVRVAELGSFSKAAMVLNIAQPALSRHVRLLETDLRTTLLIRNGRGVMMTEAGKRLYDHAVGILQLMSSVREDIEANRDVPSGRIVVGLPPSFGRWCTLPLVEEFRKNLPQAQLSIVEGLSAHLAEWIASGRADLAILLNPDPNPALDIQPVIDESICLVGTAANMHLAGPGGVAFAELARLPLIVPARTHAIRKLIETQSALLGIPLEVAWEISSIASILNLVQAGYGYALLPRSAVAVSGLSSHFVLAPIVAPTLISRLCLVSSSHKQPTPLIRHVQRVLRQLIISGAEAMDAPHNKTL